MERTEGALTLAAQVTCMIRSLHDLFWHSECSQYARVPVSRYTYRFGYGIREYSLTVRTHFKRIFSYTVANTIYQKTRFKREKVGCTDPLLNRTRYCTAVHRPAVVCIHEGVNSQPGPLAKNSEEDVFIFCFSFWTRVSIPRCFGPSPQQRAG